MTLFIFKNREYNDSGGQVYMLNKITRVSFIFSRWYLNKFEVGKEVDRRYVGKRIPD